MPATHNAIIWKPDCSLAVCRYIFVTATFANMNNIYNECTVNLLFKSLTITNVMYMRKTLISYTRWYSCLYISTNNSNTADRSYAELYACVYVPT